MRGRFGVDISRGLGSEVDMCYCMEDTIHSWICMRSDKQERVCRRLEQQELVRIVI
jgi:hypothetical protein